MRSYAVTNNTSSNIFNYIKQFIFSFAEPEILQSDNGSEYKNTLISNFCLENTLYLGK